MRHRFRDLIAGCPMAHPSKNSRCSSRRSYFCWMLVFRRSGSSISIMTWKSSDFFKWNFVTQECLVIRNISWRDLYRPRWLLCTFFVRVDDTFDHSGNLPGFYRSFTTTCILRILVLTFVLRSRIQVPGTNSTAVDYCYSIHQPASSTVAI